MARMKAVTVADQECRARLALAAAGYVSNRASYFLFVLSVESVVEQKNLS
jgi:hypothetical protein